MSIAEATPVTSNQAQGSTSKIRTLDELETLVRALQMQKKSVIHCHGVFDLLHPGHIRHFEAAKRKGDVLIVTLTRDEYVNKGPGRPVFGQQLRAESVAALHVVDYVAINEWPTAVETIRKLRPDYFVKGAEFIDGSTDVSGHISMEEKAASEVRTRLSFTEEMTFSSTKLLNSHFDVLPDEAQRFLHSFRQKHCTEKVIEALRALRTKRVLVLGDTIIDEYHFCDVLGKSSKAHCINARFISSEAHAGGVLAVANQVASFCEEVHLVTCLGSEDRWHNFITTNLKPNISTKFFVRSDAPTIVKSRFTDASFFARLFELTHINEQPLPEKTEKLMLAYLERHAADYDVVIVADFGHGLLGAHAVEMLACKAKFLAVNAQTNSANCGYNPVTRYPRADYVCVHENELRLANHDRFGALSDLIEQTAHRLRASTLTVTQANQGSTTFCPGQGLFHTPVFSTHVVDALGAGDAYLAVTAPCAAAGYPPDLLGFVGNCVGALKVATLGNKECAEPVQVFKFITTLLK